MYSPFNMEDLAAGAVEAFKLLGDARAIAVLVSGECTAELINTDFGVNYWQLMVALPIPLYYAMTDVEREATSDYLPQFARSKSSCEPVSRFLV